MNTEELTKLVEEIRREKQLYGDVRELVRWKKDTVFLLRHELSRMRELEERVCELEDKLFLQSASNYAFTLIIGILAGSLLFHVLG